MNQVRIAQLLLALLVLAPASAKAQSQTQTDGKKQPQPKSGGVQVYKVNEDLEAYEFLEKRRIQIKKDESGKSYHVPKSKIRNRLFEKAGLTEYVANWDEFEKDMLYIRAAELAIEALTMRYSSLPSQPLTECKRLIGELEKAGGKK